MPLAATPPPLRFRLQFEPELVHPEVRRCMYTAPAEGDTLTLTPGRHGTDGFFVAIMERKG